MNIGILGIGGVGGFFGGKLAAQYHDSEKVRITFISRAATVAAIRERGLELRAGGARQIVHPHQVVSDTEGLPPFDVLICSTKSYDLEAALKPLRNCITSETLILPLLNGVNAGETIRRLYPHALLADGCVYINAQRVSPGIIEKNGVLEKLHFGGTGIPQSRLQSLQDILTGAGIDSHLSMEVETETWSKFVLISAMATATSYFDECIGRVLRNASHRATLESLVREAHAVAVAKGIRLPAGLAELTMTKLEGFPFEATSSMHRDFTAGGPTEYRSLTKFVTDSGAALGVATPAFDSILPDLAARDGGAAC